MESTNGDDNKPKDSEQEPLTLRQSAPPPVRQQPLESPTQTPAFQEDVTPEPPEETANGKERKELKDFERLSLRWARINAIFVGFTLVAIVGTAVVFWQQFKEMASQTNLLGISARQARRDSAESSANAIKQLAIAQRQAKAAQNSVEAIQTQMRQDQRAWVEIRFVKDEQHKNLVLDPRSPISIPLKIINVGKTLGVRVRVFAEVEIVSKNNAPELKYTPYKDLVGVIYKDMEVPVEARTHGMSADKTHVTNRPLGQADYERLTTGQAYFVFFAKVEYWDIFRKKHRTTFCGWKAFVDGEFPASKCTAYNGADNN